MNRNAQKVNPVNLRMLCWQRGHAGVTGLARHLGKHRVNIHHAVKYPRRFPRTYALIVKALVRGTS